MKRHCNHPGITCEQIEAVMVPEILNLVYGIMGLAKPMNREAADRVQQILEVAISQGASAANDLIAGWEAAGEL